MPIIDKFRYRPEIDGLRAIAIVAVVLFHAGFSCPGGFVGVDIFFVISGYLITSLIWKDLESGKFTFSKFWERRARRILPALVVVSFATLLMAWVLLLPPDFLSLGKALSYQVGFIANFYYWFNSGYFSPGADSQPLLHTWSLAVEEQFYFVIPFLLWFIYRIEKLRTRAAVLGTLAVLLVLSLGVSAFQVARVPDAAFYLLPSRAWEMLVGSFVAFLPVSPQILRKRFCAELFAWLGVGLITYSIFKYTSATAFPGLGAVLPCLGAALVIWANNKLEGSPTPSVGKLLSTRPMRFIGAISYSLYLWHWPFLAFARNMSPGPLRFYHRIALIGLSLIFAIISWKFVETPFRLRKVGNTPKAMFTLSGVALASLMACALFCIRSGAYPSRFSAQILKYANATSDVAFQNSLETTEVNAGHLVRIGSSKVSLKPSVLIWGDSHAMAATPAFDALLKEEGLAGLQATHHSTAPVLDWFSITIPPGMGKSAIPFNEAVFEQVRRQHIANVVLIGNWDRYTNDIITGSKSPTFGAALIDTVKRLKAIGASPGCSKTSHPTLLKFRRPSRTPTSRSPP